MTSFLTAVMVFSIFGLIVTLTTQNKIPFGHLDFYHKNQRFQKNKIRFGLLFAVLLVLSIYFINASI